MDIAFEIDPSTGKLTFAKNAQGNFYLDSKAVYSVLATLFARKGKWGFDESLGTYFNDITKDTSATGSRLTGVVRDALEQVQQAGHITSGTVDQVTRLRPGVWLLGLRWKTTSGETVTQQIRA